MVRAPSDPDRIYLAHDVGHLWRSVDGGRLWEHPVGRGLTVNGMVSIAVDPVDADVVLALTDNEQNTAAVGEEGLWRTTDAGESWERVLDASVDLAPASGKASREHQRTIVHDPTSVDSTGAQRWYVAIDSGVGPNSAPDAALFVSEDYGTTWVRRGDLNSFGDIHALVIGADGQQLYLAAEGGRRSGAFVSDDGGSTFVPVPGLPTGGAGWVEFGPGGDLWVALVDIGVYHSTDGVTWRLVFEGDATSVFVHPTDDPSRAVVIGASDQANVTDDDGKTWTPISVEAPLGLDRDTRWKTTINSGRYPWMGAAVSWDPRDPDVAVAYGHAQVFRTEDGGRTWKDSSAGYTGYNASRWSRSIWFDREDPDRLAFFLMDVSMVVSEDGGATFERRRSPDSIRGSRGQRRVQGR